MNLTTGDALVQPFTYAGTERNNASQNKRKKPGNGEVPENGGGWRKVQKIFRSMCEQI